VHVCLETGLEYPEADFGLAILDKYSSEDYSLTDCIMLNAWG